MMIKGIVDRIEGNLVVVEFEKGTKDFAKERFPPSIQAGDAVYKDGDSFIIDEGMTKKLKKEIEELMDDLFVD